MSTWLSHLTPAAILAVGYVAGLLTAGILAVAGYAAVRGAE